MVHEEKKTTNIEEVNKDNFEIFKKLLGAEELCMVQEENPLKRSIYEQMECCS